MYFLDRRNNKSIVKDDSKSKRSLISGLESDLWKPTVELSATTILVQF